MTGVQTCALPILKSLNTQNESRDNHLKSADYFDVAQFPVVTFESNEILTDSSKIFSNGFIAKGKLTVKGITKNVNVYFTYAGKKKFTEMLAEKKQVTSSEISEIKKNPNIDSNQELKDKLNALEQRINNLNKEEQNIKEGKSQDYETTGFEGNASFIGQDFNINKEKKIDISFSLEANKMLK